MLVEELIFKLLHAQRCQTNQSEANGLKSLSRANARLPTLCGSEHLPFPIWSRAFAADRRQRAPAEQPCTAVHAQHLERCAAALVSATVAAALLPSRRPTRFLLMNDEMASDNETYADTPCVALSWASVIHLVRAGACEKHANGRFI